MARRYSKIKAIHESDLAAFLERLGLYERVQSGVALCEFCRQTVTLLNLSGVFASHGEIHLCCISAACQEAFIEKGTQEGQT